MNEMSNIPIGFPIRRSNEGSRSHKARIVPEATEAPLPPGSIFEGTPKPLWESPDSQVFHEWYEQQRVLPEEEQSDNFREFSNLLSLGRAELPRYSANRTIRSVRHRNLSEEM